MNFHLALLDTRVPMKWQVAVGQNVQRISTQALSTLVMVLILGCSDVGTTRTSSPQSQSSAEQSYEYKLAVINASGYVDPNDITVKRFRYLLDQIRSDTGYTDERISDMTVRGQEILREKYGKNVKLLDLMEACRNTLTGSPKDKYENIVAITVMAIGQ